MNDKEWKLGDIFNYSTLDNSFEDLDFEVDEMSFLHEDGDIVDLESLLNDVSAVLDGENFLGTTNLPDSILEIHSMVEYFLHLFPQDIFALLAAKKHYDLKPMEVQKFIGMVVLMSCVKLPKTVHHWNASIGSTIIRNTMSLKEFEKLRQTFYFHDGSTSNIKLIIEKFNENLAKIPLEECLTVDKLVWSKKAKMLSRIKQSKHEFNENTLDIFMLRGQNGFVHRLDLDGIEQIIRYIPKHRHHKINFNNNLINLPLLVDLRRQGILGVGLIKSQDLLGFKLTQIEKQPLQFVGNVNDVDFSVFLCKDLTRSALVSTFIGNVLPMYKDSTRLEFLHNLGEFDGLANGGDGFFTLLHKHKIIVRSKCWQMMFFYYFIDIVMMNSWLLYKRSVGQKQKQGEKMCKELTYLEFRLEVVISLCKMESKVRSGREILGMSIENSRKVPAQTVPCEQVGHWPVWINKRTRCKFPACRGICQIKCEKCDIALCFNKNNNCFRNFHNI